MSLLKLFLLQFPEDRQGLSSVESMVSQVPQGKGGCQLLRIYYCQVTSVSVWTGVGVWHLPEVWVNVTVSDFMSLGSIIISFY